MIFTPEKTRGLAVCLLDMLPVKFGNGFHAEHWNNLLTRLREEFDCDATKGQVKNKYDELRKKYVVFHNLIKNTGGNRWNPETGKINVTDEFWSDYIKKNPLAEKFKFREKPFEFYNIMHEIINGALPFAKTSRNVDETPTDDAYLSDPSNSRPTSARSKRKRTSTFADELEDMEEGVSRDIDVLDTPIQVVSVPQIHASQSEVPAPSSISEGGPPRRRRKTEKSMISEAVDRLISARLAEAIDRLTTTRAQPAMSFDSAQQIEAVRLVNLDYKGWESDDRALALRVMKDCANVRIFLNTDAGETRDKWLRLEMNALK